MLARGGEVIGVFQVLNKFDGPFTNEDEDWLEGLTAVAAGLIEQAQAYGEIERFVDKTLETLAQTIDQRDPLTAGHSIRVTNYSLLVGQAMNVPDDDIDVLRLFSNDARLRKDRASPKKSSWKDGRLTPEEYATVQKHASITYDLLSNLPFTRRLQDVPFVASCHHEKVDGSGYYRGLKGEDIPFLSENHCRCRRSSMRSHPNGIIAIACRLRRCPESCTAVVTITLIRLAVDAFFKLPSARVHCCSRIRTRACRQL